MARDRELPRARSDGLIIRDLEDEVLVYDLERHKAHCLNKTAALIWKHCDGRTKVPRIKQMLEKGEGAPVHEDIVWFGLRELERAHLLQDPIMDRSDRVSVSRREAMKRIGFTVAVGLPLVTSIIAPQASEAATNLPNGSPCTASNQCASNCCVTNSQGKQVCASPGGPTVCI
jgi:hypothetical protein